MGDADALMAKFRISGVPVTEGRRLVGIITNRDLKFETDFTKKIKESMTAEGLIKAPDYVFRMAVGAVKHHHVNLCIH